ncbi:pilus assembly protein TadG-related protein [uncultured Roseibium sp.]|uniref:pilus assembly protein TadG-related protein n=1 Tax=uncultured Roseibium sp. TaxID=1936171 RepID=UPI003217D4AB
MNYKASLIQLKKYNSDQRGSIMPMFAILGVMLMVIAGAAVDYSRAVNNREKMAHALDAAALTLATKLSTSVMTDSEIDTLLGEAFAANIQTLGLDDVAISNLTHNVDPDNGVIDIATTVSVPTQFLSMGGIGPDNLTVHVKTEVNYSRFNVELALVLDVTGSMKYDIDTLQDASNDLLDTLIPEGTDESDSKVKISIIPYSQGVNLGSDASTVTNGDASGNCVTERLGEAQYTDDAYNYTPTDASLVSSSYFGGGSGSCPNNSMSLLPLTNDRDALQTKISALDDGGGTAGQTGVAWGWYTLSPNWSNVWPTDSAPGAYDDDELLKFAIIMTDGDNNRYYDQDIEKCGWKYNYSKNKYEYTCYTVTGWSEVSESQSYSNESSTRQRALCQAMKDEGITVYGIYFGTNTSSAGAKNMSACATDASTFYQANSSSELISAFGNIAKKIQAIYLAK